MAKVLLKNQGGVVKELKVGFSWTTFFFGGWVAMFRGQWGEVAKWFFLNPITLGIWGLAQCWTTNKKTVVSFIEKGYEPATDNDKALLVQKQIVA
ncbi:DUF2628 domain-containing protein [Cytobacillus firmus]|uniref:DUF2628 domain-containing protein n=1 Tax=Cytobacillus firmus TaxID=1399 RepID=UPI0018CF946E|nr:DUF2628 domain-containing protein [Cytobacillus firmus]MBG9444244.1 hypothetical protein [Cytobacillus firmus]MCS0654840.1 DUF2628 domain-containing protein [Cytobacillus firmus]USK38719.1 DUF2628 domain-containing protein [Cytobacillus firmus]